MPFDGFEGLADGRFVTSVSPAEAKGLLSKQKSDDNLFGILYNANFYRGCGHGCLYCDTRSECYGIVDISRITVKVNSPALLRRELAAKREKGTVGTGSMNDPYQPVEERIGMVRECLGIMLAHGFPVHVITKGNLVARDADILSRMASELGHACVTFSITTLDDGLAAWLEPGAPPPSERLAAMRCLSGQGITVGAAMMPLIPGLTDDSATVRAVAGAVAANGGSHALPGCLTLRDNGRTHLHAGLALHTPRALAAVKAVIGEGYLPSDGYQADLYERVGGILAEVGLSPKAPRWGKPPEPERLSLF